VGSARDLEETVDGETFRWKGGIGTTLQQNWGQMEKTNAVTTIFGYNENEDQKSSAIPVFFDDWFHGDFKTNRPSDLSGAKAEKSLEEYADTYPEYRINSVVEIGFDSDGQTISDHEVRITNPDDQYSSGGQAPITLEGASDEPGNPFRNELDHYDDHRDTQTLLAEKKAPFTKSKKITVTASSGTNIEGIRGSIIYGGSDKYLKKAKQNGENLSALVGYMSGGITGLVPAALSRYYAHLPPFYTFLDFAFMADGARIARIWDASRYPAHSLYVGGDLEGRNKFRENIEWTPQGPALEHHAFNNFALEAQLPGRTPFSQGGSWAYKNWHSGVSVTIRWQSSLTQEIN